MSILDHLTPADLEIVLDKTARYLAEIQSNQKTLEIQYKGQKAVAQRLGCSVDTICKLMQEQRLPYIRVGKKGYVFTERGVLDYQKAA